MVATADGYMSGIRPVLGRLADSQAANVTAVARPIADALPAGDTLQAFGTGHSGINAGVVEVALLIRQRGDRLNAITSVEHTLRVTPGHPSGQRLADLADVVPDNGAPYGDVLPSLESGGAVCRVSSVTDALIAQLVVAEVVRRIETAGEVAPVYLSANVPGGDEHNHAIESRYAGRIRRTA